MQLDLKVKTKTGHPAIITIKGRAAIEVIEDFKRSNLLIELPKKPNSDVIAIYGFKETTNWYARANLVITLWKDESYIVLRY